MAHQLSSLSNLSSTNLSKYQYNPRPLSCKPKPSTFRVNNSSSNSSSADDESYKIDRRKMVLGLGASNLIIPGSKAFAADDGMFGPIHAPNFTSCSNPENATGADPLPSGTVCCLPPSDSIQDFKFPPPTKLRKRRPAHKKAAAEDMRKYAMAVAEMKKLSAKDPNDPIGWTMQANVHCAYCNHVYHQTGTDTGLPIQIHFSWLFYPFHRWYLYFYERILGSLINDPTFALPYWNWDNPEGMYMPPLFQDQGPVYGALYDANRDPLTVNGAVINYSFSQSTDDAGIISANTAAMRSQMITTPADVYAFMGAQYCQGIDALSATGQGSIENGAHGGVHWVVGNPASGPLKEDMGNFYSAGRDAVFYSHHANVDRLWSIWQGLPTDYDKTIKLKSYLDTEFLLYNEKRELVRVKVKDALDNRKLGYVYERSDISSWLNARPVPQSDDAKSKISDTKAKLPSAESVFPAKLKDIIKVVVKKSKIGQADEVLVLEDIELKTNKFAKFDVFVNDEDDQDFTRLDTASYLGSFGHVPLGGGHSSKIKTFTRLRLTDLYTNMDLEGDDTIVVTLVARRVPGDQAVTIGAIKVVENTH